MKAHQALTRSADPPGQQWQPRYFTGNACFRQRIGPFTVYSNISKGVLTAFGEHASHWKRCHSPAVRRRPYCLSQAPPFTAWMRTFTGRSENTDAHLAVEEATRAVPSGFVPDIVFCFASVKQAPDAVAGALAARFPNSLAIGCTTAGEIVNGQRSRLALPS